MNYKELWEQARALAFEEPVDMDGPLEGIKGFNQQVYEKFGELIVRECAVIADEPTSQPFSSYGEKIKQHFGVKE